MKECVERVLISLLDQYNIKDIVKDFKKCSYDDNNDRYLVDSNVQTIDFDLFTKRLKKADFRQSADCLSFSDSHLYLIEFKSGDQTRQAKKLIENVSGKIHDSADTILNYVFTDAFSAQDNLPALRFYLVVDSKRMGINALILTQANLSKGAQLPFNLKVLLDRILPELREGIANEQYYDVIDIWYSDFFDQHINAHRIKDVSTLIS